MRAHSFPSEVISEHSGEPLDPGVPRSPAIFPSDSILIRPDFGPGPSTSSGEELVNRPVMMVSPASSASHEFRARDVLGLNFVRPGSLGLAGDEEPKWCKDTVRVIEVDEGLLHPVRLEVREYEPAPGDVTGRAWLDRTGNKQVVELATYALADIEKTRNHLKEYIQQGYLEFAEAVCDPEPLVREVHEEAAAECEGSFGPLLQSCLKLCFGMRLTMGSSHISGTEKLGTEPIYHQDHPLCGRVSPPRKVTDQYGRLLREILFDLQRDFLKRIGDELASKSLNPLYPMFLAVFVVLHEVDAISRDRFRYARQFRIPARFSLPEFVEELHTSAHSLLIHWFSFNRGIGVNWIANTWGQIKQALSFLEKPELSLIMRCYDEFDPGHEQSPSKDPVPALRFVSQMYGPSWNSADKYVADHDTWGPEDDQAWWDRYWQAKPQNEKTQEPE